MNIYVIVEGVTEKPVYKFWIPLVNKNLKYVDDIFEINKNNFAIISGGGYPGYYETIERAIEDVNAHGNIDRFVIAIDSENLTKEEKLNEVREFLKDKACLSPIFVLVQHFCFETWALGNRRIMKRNAQSEKLKNYKEIFNVAINDPELLQDLNDEGLNRSQFAYKYLKAILNERFRNLTYTKRNPKPILHMSYFKEVKKRLKDTGHIFSFKEFLNSFI